MFLRHKEEAIFTGINLNRTNRCHYDALYNHSVDIRVWVNSPMHEWDCSHTGCVSRDWKFCLLSSWKGRSLKKIYFSIVWPLFSNSYCTQTAKCQLSIWLSTTAVNFAWGCFSNADTLSVSSPLPDCMFLFSFYHTKIVSAVLYSPHLIHDWLQTWH